MTKIEPVVFRSRDLGTGSNRLLISLLAGDFLMLVTCYINSFQGWMGYPVFGVYGTFKLISQLEV